MVVSGILSSCFKGLHQMSRVTKVVFSVVLKFSFAMHYYYGGCVSVGLLDSVDACDPQISRTRHLAPMNRVFRFICPPGFKFLTKALIITILFFILIKHFSSFFYTDQKMGPNTAFIWSLLLL